MRRGAVKGGGSYAGVAVAGGSTSTLGSILTTSKPNSAPDVATASPSARLDHDDSDRVHGEQLGEGVGFGLVMRNRDAELGGAGGARINAGDALEPAQIDCENNVGDGKPPKVSDGRPLHDTTTACMDSFGFADGDP